MKKIFTVMVALSAMIMSGTSCKKDSEPENKITPEKEWCYMDAQSGCYQVFSIRDGVFINGMIITEEYYNEIKENKPSAASKVNPGDLVGLKNSYNLQPAEDGVSGTIEAILRNPGSSETFTQLIQYSELTMDKMTIRINDETFHLETLSSLGLSYGAFRDMVELDLI